MSSWIGAPAVDYPKIFPPGGLSELDILLLVEYTGYIDFSRDKIG